MPLSVDIVPVIEDAARPGYGWQFDIHDGTKMQTCAPCQIKFVRDRKENRHSGLALPLHPVRCDYINEKLECIFAGSKVLNAAPAAPIDGDGFAVSPFGRPA